MKIYQTTNEDPERVGRGKTLRYLPLVVALGFGAFWAVLYLFLGRIHGMWAMFDKEFPFLITAVLGIHEAEMSPGVGALLAFVDSVVAVFLILWTLRFLVARRKRVEPSDPTRQ